MNALLIYLAQMIAASGLLYGYYHIALRNNQFHQYNRFYLLSITVISIIIPFLDIPLYFTAAEKESSIVLQTITAIAPAGIEPSVVPVQTGPVHTGISLVQVLVGAYVLIALLVLLRSVISLLRIRQLIRKYPSGKIGTIRFVNTHEPGTPFSFFRWLFWNRDIELHSEKGQQVFRHEVYHIEQKHSLDLVYAELLTVCCWINPFFHLIKKELRAIHEFLADRFAINEQQKWEYAEMLLMQALGTKQSLINPFFQTHIKRRIAMITLSKKPGYRYTRKLLVLPVTALAFILFAFSYHEKKPAVAPGAIEKAATADTTGKPEKAGLLLWQKTENSTIVKSNHLWVSPLKSKRKVEFEQKLLVLNGDIMPIQSIYKKQIMADSIFVYGPDDADAITLYGDKARNGLLIFKNAVLSDDLTLAGNKDADKIFDKVEIESSFPGGDPAWRNFVTTNMDAAVADKNNAPLGTFTTVIMFIVDTDGKISDIKPLTHHGYGMEEEAIRVIKLSPSWLPARQNGMIVKAYRRLPITFVSKKKDKAAVSPANDNIIFSKVEIEPSFPGGDAKFREYIAFNQQQHSKTLATSPYITNVTVQFIVHTNGTVSDVAAIGADAASAYTTLAVNLVKNGPNWIPAVQNGKPVKAYKQQVFAFAPPAGNQNPAVTAPIIDYIQTMPELSVGELRQATVHQLLQLDKNTEIIDYVFSIDTDDGKVSEAVNNGNQFSALTRQLFQNAKAGKLISFDRIKIRLNGEIKKITSVVYRLVN